MPPIRSTSSAESSSNHRAVKRARAIQSCALCRKKKIKCDRQDPCSACIAKGEYCHWEVPPPPPQHKYQYAAELCSEMTPEEEVVCLRRLVRVLSTNVPSRTFEDMVKSITPKYKLRDWAQRAAGVDHEHASDNEIVPKSEPFEMALPSPALTSSEHEHSDVDGASSCFSSPMISSEEPEFNHGQPYVQQPSAFGAVAAPNFSLPSSPLPNHHPVLLNATFGSNPLAQPPYLHPNIFSSMEPIPFVTSPAPMSADDYAQLQAQTQAQLGQSQCGPVFSESEEMSGSALRGVNGIGAQMLAGGQWPFGVPPMPSPGFFTQAQGSW